MLKVFAARIKMSSSLMTDYTIYNCLKRARIRSYSGLHFPAFGLNFEAINSDILLNNCALKLSFCKWEKERAKIIL